MATLAFGVVGAAIGTIWGNPLAGWSVGTVVGGLLFPPRTEQQARGRLDDLRVSGAAYGTIIPQCWGDCRVGGQVVWATPLQEHVSSSGGGKGGGQPTTNQYSYTVSMAVAVCRGPIVKVLKIWAEDLVVYDDSQTPKTKYNVAVYLGDETQVADPTMKAALDTASLPTPAHRGLAYVVFTDMDLTPWGGRVPNMSFEVEATTGQALSGVLSDLLGQAGLAAGDLDVTLATDAVAGYVLASRVPAREATEPLTRAFAGDLVEADGKIKWVPRGLPPALFLSDGDLGAAVWQGDAPSAEPPVRVKRLQDVELPVTIDVSYFSTARQLQQASQRAVRYTKSFQQEALTITLPMSLSDDDARRVAERMLYQAWLERSEAAHVASIRHARLAPGDVFVAQVAGSPQRLRVVSWEHEPFGLVSLRSVSDDAGVLDRHEVGAVSPGGSSPFSGTPSVATAVWAGTAARDSDAALPGLYAAACGPAGWGGCAVWLSRDGGLSYQQVGYVTDYSVMGQCLTTLGAAQGETADFDQSSTVDVQVTRGAPQTASYWDVLAGANAAIIGDEIVQFETSTAIDVSAGKYRLSGLLRGRRGTDGLWTHVGGERFVLLGPATLRLPLDLSAVGKQVLVKFVPPGTSVGAATAVPVTVSGYELWPYAGCHLFGSRDGSSNLTIEWARRTRVGGQWADLVDAALGETTQSYEVDIIRTLLTLPPASPALPQNISSTTGVAFTFAIPAGTYSAASLRRVGAVTGTAFSDYFEEAHTTGGNTNIKEITADGPVDDTVSLVAGTLSDINAAAGGNLTLTVRIQSPFVGSGSDAVSALTLVLTPTVVGPVRTISVSWAPLDTHPQAAYTAAQQTTDFGSAQPSVEVNVYQMGQLGRGFVLHGYV